MNWRGGLFRVWIATSAVWIICVGVSAYLNVTQPTEVANRAWSEERASQRAAQGPHGFIAADFTERPAVPSYTPYAVAMVAGPMAMFMGWFGLMWVGAGFRNKKAN